MSTVSQITDKIYRAQRDGNAIAQFGETLTLADAYAVQAQLHQRRLADGETPTGRKLGFTSYAKMKQMGVENLIIGFLTDAMAEDEFHRIDISKAIHPRIEPEVAFKFTTDVSHRDDVSAWEEAVGAVAAAVEVIDSRYEAFKFSLPDVVADNTSACGYAIGPWQELTTPFADATVKMTLDGHPVATGNTSAILGGPWNVLAELHGLAQEYELDMAAGDVLLAGAATEAVHIGDALAAVVAVEGFPEIVVEFVRD